MQMLIHTLNAPQCHVRSLFERQPAMRPALDEVDQDPSRTLVHANLQVLNVFETILILNIQLFSGKPRGCRRSREFTENCNIGFLSIGENAEPAIKRDGIKSRD